MISFAFNGTIRWMPLARAASNVFSGVQGVERDDPPGDIKFGQKLLCCGDFVRSCVNFDMRKDQHRVRSKGAAHLPGGAVVKGIEAAPQGFCVDCQNAATCRLLRLAIKIASMGSKRRLNCVRGKANQNGAQRGVRWRAFSARTKGPVQPLAVHADEGLDPPTGIGSRHDGEDRKQQHMDQRVTLAFSPAGSGTASSRFNIGANDFIRATLSCLLMVACL